MGGKFGWEGFAWGFRAPRGWRRGRRQWFGSGDMKYVILKLLRDKPRHGYEVMKDLEERKDIVEDIFDRVTETVERTVGGSMVEVNRALGQLVKAVYRTGWKAETD